MTDEPDDFEVTNYPPWREALRRFVASGFGAGEVIPHEWFYEALGLDQPRPNTPFSVGEAVRLEYLRQLTLLRQALLTEYKVDLASKPGVGYEVIPSREQSGRAYDEGQAKVKAALLQMKLRMVHTDVARLTDEERRDYANDLARAAAMANAVRHARKGLRFDEGE